MNWFLINKIAKKLTFYNRINLKLMAKSTNKYIHIKVIPKYLHKFLTNDIIVNYKHLRKLKIDTCKLTNNGIKVLTELRVLHIIHSSKLLKDNVIYKLNKLRAFIIYEQNENITEKSISQLVNLRYLCLKHYECTNTMIKNMNNLRFLSNSMFPMNFDFKSVLYKMRFVSYVPINYMNYGVNLRLAITQPSFNHTLKQSTKYSINLRRLIIIKNQYLAHLINDDLPYLMNLRDLNTN